MAEHASTSLPYSANTLKAAALLLNLEMEHAAEVLRYLDESNLEQVMLAVTELKAIPKEIRHTALQEAFVMASKGASQTTGGLEFTRQLLAKSIGPRRGADMLDRITASQALSSFEILQSADPAKVAELLTDELPQTIALVLSYLDAKDAASILANMPPNVQVAVTMKLSTMDRVSPTVVKMVEQSLKNKLSAVISAVGFRATGGVDFLVKVLNQVDRGTQKTILDTLSGENPFLVDEIKANLFTFDDLIKLDDRAMQRVLRDVNKNDLALALKGASQDLRNLIFRNMSERARENLQEEIEIIGPQLAKNVYAAQRAIVDVVRTLEDQEEILIGGGGGGDEEIIV